MRFILSSVFLILTISALLGEGHRHHHKDKKHHKSVFHKFGEDIKNVADKFSHDVKKGAEDVDHVAKAFGDDVDHFIKSFKGDVVEAYTKAEPFLSKAFVILHKVRKSLKEVEETGELMEMLADAAA